MTTEISTAIEVSTDATAQPSRRMSVKTRIKWKLASCSGMGSAMFFDTTNDELAIVRSICRTCPISLECLLYGMTQEFGTWGGITESERQHNVTRKKIKCSTCNRRAVLLTYRQVVSEVCMHCGTSCQLS
jgi:hypothetical protein